MVNLTVLLRLYPALFRIVTVTRWGWSEERPLSGVTAIQGVSSASQRISLDQSRFAVTLSCRVVRDMSAA